MGIRGMVDDLELRQGYVEKGLRRAKEFTWEKSRGRLCSYSKKW